MTRGFVIKMSSTQPHKSRVEITEKLVLQEDNYGSSEWDLKKDAGCLRQRKRSSKNNVFVCTFKRDVASI